MAESFLITSVQNPKIKEAVKLRERRTRDQTGLFLIEGYRELSRALLGNQSIQHVFWCSEFFLGSNEIPLLQDLKQHGAHLYSCDPKVFRKLSYRDRPDGLIGIAQQKIRDLKSLKLSLNPFLVVAESIEKPGNLGTILRSSDATGVDALIVCDSCTDPFNPNVVRASVGTLFTVPVIEASSQDALQWFKNHNIKIVAATPHAESLYHQVNFNQPVVIALGTEQYGLSEQWMEQADIKVKIPMYGVADSLNVAMATTVLLYEVLRQRGT
ncbi:MAG: RNA methyltransferase [Chlamydiales bacterium]